jgi:hypothetical protein
MRQKVRDRHRLEPYEDERARFRCDLEGSKHPHIWAMRNGTGTELSQAKGKVKCMSEPLAGK